MTPTTAVSTNTTTVKTTVSHACRQALHYGMENNALTSRTHAACNHLDMPSMPWFTDTCWPNLWRHWVRSVRKWVTGGDAVINTIELCIIAIEPQATCTIIIIIIQLVVASMCKLCEYVHRTYMYTCRFCVHIHMTYRCLLQLTRANFEDKYLCQNAPLAAFFLFESCMFQTLSKHAYSGWGVLIFFCANITVFIHNYNSDTHQIINFHILAHIGFLKHYLATYVHG